MDRAAVPASNTAAVLFRDGLGERRHIADPSGNDTLEILCLRNELSTVPSFEFALRERVSRLSTFRHAQFGRVRTVERMNDSTLAMISERFGGVRLSDMLVNADQRRLGLDITAALCLIRQLVPAMAAFHESARDIAHGTVGPERIVVTPNGQVVIMEYVLGAALEQLRFPREKYWSELRVALPASAGLPRFDQRADVTQIGVVALSLILGRPMRDDEFPARIADVVASTWAVSPRGGFEPLPSGLRAWLGRALQLDARSGFTNAIEARNELDKVLGETADYNASQASLATFLTRYNGGAPTSVARPTPVPQAAVPAAATPSRGTPMLGTPMPGTPMPGHFTPALGTPRPATATPTRAAAAAPAAAAPTAAAVPPVQTTPPRGTAVAPPVAAPVNPAAAATPAFGTARPPAAPLPTHSYGTSNPAIGGMPPAQPVATPPSGTPSPVLNTPARGTPYPSLASALTPPPSAAPQPQAAPPPAAPPLQLQSMAESVTVKTPPRGVARAQKPIAHDVHQTTAIRIPTVPPPAPAPVVDDEEEAAPAVWKKYAALAAAVVVLAAIGAYQGRQYLMPVPSQTGTVVFTTNPPGAQVVVDGQVRGVTPITLTISAGSHNVDLHGASGSKTIPVSIAAGTQIAQYIELPLAAPTSGVGQLQIRTEPAGAKVTVDGVARGASPITVADLAPGEHIVLLESDLGSMKQSVTIEAGVTASLVVPLAAPEGAPVSGWIAVTSPVEMQLFEKDHLLGTSRTDRLMVSAGRHEVDIVNDDIGYRTTRTVQVNAGKVAAVNIELPNGSIAINAVPWAEVWIDGAKVGETPIGNHSLPIGTHDVVFRNPDLGELHKTVTVTLKNAARLSVDLRKKP